jgi:succinate dehydrogenase hydrophobic anchor subunit
MQIKLGNFLLPRLLHLLLHTWLIMLQQQQKNWASLRTKFLQVWKLLLLLLLITSYVHQVMGMRD